MLFWLCFWVPSCSADSARRACLSDVMSRCTLVQLARPAGGHGMESHGRTWQVKKDYFELLEGAPPTKDNNVSKWLSDMDLQI